VNQRGESQAIGGVNEKIEGYYDACMAAGFTGRQGVIIPAANADDLMLREDIVAACADGRFHIHAVHSVDEAMELLTAQPFDGPDSITAKADAALRALGERLRAFGDAAPSR
jgi:predicted ATP-dependent protease